MKKALLSLFFCTSLAVGALPLAEFPQAAISNEMIQAKLYLPDMEKGYYQATRFDWSGVVYSLEYKGHQYFGPWFEHYDPKLHDAITGPVEEFTPLGYEEATPGEIFVKIGVGALRKPEESAYRFATTYEIADPGKWQVHRQQDQVEFVHKLTDAAGYSYVYTKRVKLTPGKPEMVLEHRLRNTGQRPIETEVYDHNFFVIDNQPTGPEITIKFPFNVQAEGKGIGDIAQLEANQIGYIRALDKSENIYTPALTGFGDSAKDYDIRIENSKTGAGVRITGDQPLSKVVFWASSTTSCPEPYIRLQAAPGEEVNWTIHYKFYTFSKDGSK